MSKQIPSGLARPLDGKRLCRTNFLLQKAFAVPFDRFSIGGFWAHGLDAGPEAYSVVEFVMYGL